MLKDQLGSSPLVLMCVFEETAICYDISQKKIHLSLPYEHHNSVTQFSVVSRRVSRIRDNARQGYETGSGMETDARLNFYTREG